MRGSLSGAFVRKSGDTMTGGLTIASDAVDLLTLNRLDGTAHTAIKYQRAGADSFLFQNRVVEPSLVLADSAGTFRLGIRTDTGLLGSALIPLSMLRREELDGENAGLVTLPAAGFITIVDVTAAAAVAVGDRVVCWVDLVGTKSATLGPVLLQLVDQGTANVQWAKDAITAANRWDVEASAVVQLSWCTVARVVGAGVLTMRLQGGCIAGTMAVAAGAGELRMLILRDGA